MTFCKAKAAIEQEVDRLRREASKIESEIRWTEKQLERSITPIAKIRDDYVTSCPEGYEPVMVFDGGGDAYYGYQNRETDDWIDANTWPFEQDFVWHDDCEKNGIRVEIA